MARVRLKQVFLLFVAYYSILPSVITHDMYGEQNIMKEVVCEGMSMGLECLTGNKIHIISANYGRSTNSVCRDGPIRTTHCHDEASLHIVKERCENKSICVIPAKNLIFGDPCVNTHKYLEVNYVCLSGEYLADNGNITNRKVACEGQILNIICPEDYYINISKANYGRTNFATCRDGPIQTTDCYTSNTLMILNDKCKNKQSCLINANNEMFGDPCVNTFKYLDVLYSCQKKEEKEDSTSNEGKQIVCPGEILKLECQNENLIHIINASFGRKVNVCNKKGMSYGKSKPFDLGCKEAEAISILKKNCEWKSNCQLLAGTLFKDSCSGTYIYLEVSFICTDGPTWPNLTDVGDPRMEERTPTVYIEPNEKEDLWTAIVCEGSVVDLKCQEGQQLRVGWANFGREETEDRLCLKREENAQSKSCFGEQTLAVTRELCGRRQNCSLIADVETFGDPCPNVLKYLKIKYICEKVNQIIIGDSRNNESRRIVGCEGETLVLSCQEENKVLHIKEAIFGRSDGVTCPGPIQTLQCKGEGTLEIVKERCEAKNQCGMDIESAIFGDPCWNTYKYLTIDYSCI